MSSYTPKANFSAEERRQMERIVGTLPTKSAKIRALDAAGYKRAKIAAFLKTRYQHVRNVLGPIGFSEGANAVAEQAPRPPTTSEPEEETMHGRCVVDQQGRITLPQSVLVALDVEPGAIVPWRFEDGELKLMGREAGIRFAQAMVADLVKQHPGSWADDLIAERRAEAEREDAEQRHG
jgi:hypothetical protein